MGFFLQGLPGIRGPMGFPGAMVCVHDRFTNMSTCKILMAEPQFDYLLLHREKGEQMGTRVKKDLKVKK